MPAISATASRNSAGVIHLSLVNLDPHHAVTVSAHVTGQVIAHSEGRVLTAATIDAHNTFDALGVVTPVALNGITISGDTVQISIPPKSVATLSLEP